MPKLARPKNFRLEIPHVCAFCRWFLCHSRDEYWYCQREGYDFRRRDFGVDGRNPFRYTCDRFEKLGSDK